jgi:hypothetical protein
MLFKIFSIIFITPCQLILVVGDQVLPIDYATTLIVFIFLIVEIILSARAMLRVTKRQAAVYYLRNTQTSVLTSEEPIKTSAEIEEELYYNFPNLKRQYYPNNNHINKSVSVKDSYSSSAGSEPAKEK